MIYPCPYCDTELNLQPEHIGRRITCPACNRSFIADDLPPVTIATPDQIKAESPTSFKNIFNIVLKVFLSILILSVIITIGYLIFDYAMSPSIEDKVDAAMKDIDPDWRNK